MASKAAFYQQVDQNFYKQVKQENGGTLPPDLTDADGNPRKLTMSDADRGYRQKWLAIAAKDRKSKAVVNKDVDSPCVPCAIKAAASKIPPILLPTSNMGKLAKLKTVAATETEPPSPKHTTPSDERCKHETLTVECAHEDRGFKLELPRAVDAKDPTTTFAVLDDGHEKVTCTTKITAGPCSGSHKGKVFDIYPGDSVVSQSDSEMVFQAQYQPDLKGSSFLDLFPPTKSRSPQTFNINVNTCEQDTLSATVAVYPQVDWSLDISLGLSSDSEHDKSSIKFDGSVGLTVQGLKRSFGGEINNDLQSALRFVEIAANTAELISSISDTLGEVKVTLDGPSLAFSGTWGWREIEGSPECGYGYTWSLGFSPLISAEIEVDILSVLLNLFPAIGQIVDRIRQLAEKELTIKVNFAVKGTLNGTFKAGKTAGESADCSGDLNGELEFTLEGLIGSTVEWWGFYVGAELKLGAHATFSGDVTAGVDGKGPYYQGDLKFEGLKIYGVAHAGAGFTNDEPPPEEVDDDSVSGGGTLEWTLFPEKTILDSAKQYFLGEEDGD